jgi:hypothetical protein
MSGVSKKERDDALKSAVLVLHEQGLPDGDVAILVGLDEAAVAVMCRPSLGRPSTRGLSMAERKAEAQERAAHLREACRSLRRLGGHSVARVGAIFGLTSDQVYKLCKPTAEEARRRVRGTR